MSWYCNARLPHSEAHPFTVRQSSWSSDRCFPVLPSRSGIGLLIGLERGWRTRAAESGSRAAGVRTFAISGLLGGIVGAIAQSTIGTGSASGGIVLPVGFAAYAAVITVFCWE